LGGEIINKNPLGDWKDVEGKRIKNPFGFWRQGREKKMVVRNGIIWSGTENCL